MPFYNEAAEIGYNHTAAHLNMKKKMFLQFFNIPSIPSNFHTD